MKRSARSSAWFWILLVVCVFVGYSGVVAVSTHDSACARPDSPKTWVFFPPHWECDRRL